MTRWPGCSRAELDPTKLITFAQGTRIWRRKGRARRAAERIREVHGVGPRGLGIAVVLNA
jgi:hypothetical protein